MGFSLLSKVTSGRTRRNGLRLHQAGFKLHISKKFFTKRMVRLWKRLPGETVELSSLGIFKRHCRCATEERASLEDWAVLS